jgi:four helix bundle protein
MSPLKETLGTGYFDEWEGKLALISRFEDIHAWQEARASVKMVYALTGARVFSKDLSLRDQLRRAAVSIMANIAEGFDCESKVEFARFLGIARRSAVEVQSHLYAALDLSYISEVDFKSAYDQLQRVKALVGGFKKALKNHS